MAGSIVNTYGSTNTNLSNFMTVLDGTRRGHDSISLTNMSTTSVPAIAAGGQIEIAGSLYQFSTEEAISTAGVTSTSDATWYVRLTPSSSLVTAGFSTVAPTWREDYSGWYYSTASADRYCGVDMIVSSGTYVKHTRYNSNANQTFRRTWQSTGICGALLSTISYLSGWNAQNTHVDSIKVCSNVSTTYWVTGGAAIYCIFTTNIQLHHNSTAYTGGYYIVQFSMDE